MSRPLDRGRYRGPDAGTVRQMFGAIADRYDLLNHLLSLSIDRRWRRRAVATIAKLEPQPGDRCLDVCTGTGDLGVEIARRLDLPTVGADFCHPMLVKSRAKPARGGMPLPIAEADAERLPFPESTFRFATVAFGLRNVEAPEKALAEMLRVLEPGGTAIVLEFARPVVPVFAWFFDFYFVRVLPWIGRVVSGVDGPYRYLPESVRKFPAQREFSRLMEEVGFVDVDHVNLSGGIAALYSGRKPEGSSWTGASAATAGSESTASAPRWARFRISNAPPCAIAIL